MALFGMSYFMGAYVSFILGSNIQAAKSGLAEVCGRLIGLNGDTSVAPAFSGRPSSRNILNRLPPELWHAIAANFVVSDCTVYVPLEFACVACAPPPVAAFWAWNNPWFVGVGSAVLGALLGSLIYFFARRLVRRFVVLPADEQAKAEEEYRALLIEEIRKIVSELQRTKKRQ
ncbi:hypothetical protein B0A49_10974 [Cryomyces minteri]|uniref:Uncharacterized protein n=1 Tax=Cryomyces minteri TaxID=331657 RepID=A0A4U0WGR6_9PEZI|nr:hypothetical protein B0A49_10974 [Cryomyces minteri]